MALGGLSPLIIITFFKEVNTASLLNGLVPSVKIPLVPIPIYLDEKLTKVLVDDYSRTISVDIMREGVSSFEKVSGDVVNLKFRAQKDNVVITALTALFDIILKSIENQNYKITVFYDNIFILNASLEQFQTSLLENSTLREINLTLANRPPEPETSPSAILGRLGTAAGF